MKQGSPRKRILFPEHLQCEWEGVFFLNTGDKTCFKFSPFTKHSGSKSLLSLSVFLTFFLNSLMVQH